MTGKARRSAAAVAFAVVGDQFTLRRQMARNLVENAGFRTLAMRVESLAGGFDAVAYVRITTAAQRLG